MNHKPTRRDFLSGSAIVGPIRDRASSVAAREFVHFSRRAMACQFSVFFPADAASHVAARRSAMALDVLDHVDLLEAQLSIYREDSEVSRLNRQAGHEAMILEGGLYALLRRAHALWQATGGAFDITAGPLSRVWGFQQRQPRLPSPQEIKAALCLVGSDKLAFDDDHHTIKFAVNELQINLGAIGKGYALDRCAATLDAAGEHTFLLHGGRSSVLAATHRTAAPWQIDLRYPFGDRALLASLYLTDHAMATSGDAVQRVTLGDQTYGHIIDPRTGWPADGIVTATAFARTAADADALATAFYLMGPEETIKFCRQNREVGAIMVAAAGPHDQVEVFATGNLPRKIEWADAEVVNRV